MPTVTEIISDAQAYADGIVTKVDNAVDAVRSAAAPTAGVTPVNYGLFQTAAGIIADIEKLRVDKPANILLDGVGGSANLNLTSFKEAPPVAPTDTLPDVPDLGVIPTFSETAPTVGVRIAPTLNTPQLPGAPTLIAPFAPVSPEYVLPTAPTFNSSVTLPEAFTFNMPTLYAAPPDFVLDPPVNNFAFAEQEFSNAMKDQLQAKLLYDIQNGGYGIEVSDEVQLWDRANSRELSASRERTEEVERVIASRGFVLPPGALLKATQKALQSMQDQRITFSREVAIKRADLFVQNRQFTFQQAQTLTATLLNYHISKMERLLNAAKYTSDAAIQFFNAKVERVRVLLQNYQIEVDVWVKLIEGEKAKVDVYRARLEAERLKSDLDQRRVDIYLAQLKGIEALENIYRTRVSAMQTFAEIEKLKLDQFRTQMDGHLAQMKAEELKLQQFDATLRSDGLQVQIYEQKVRTFSERVRAQEAQTRLVGEQNRINIENLSFKWKQQEDKMRSYQVKAEIHSRNQDVLLRGVAAKASAYASSASIVESLSKIQQSGVTINNNATNANLQAQLAGARNQLDGVINSQRNNTQAQIAVMGTYSAQAQAALAGVNAIASQTTQD